MKLDVKEFETKMKKTIENYKEALSVIRAGRANTAAISHVTVDYYGSPTAITQMAEVKVTDPKTLVISPWDASTLKSIEKAILASDVGITVRSSDLYSRSSPRKDVRKSRRRSQRWAKKQKSLSATSDVTLTTRAS